MGASASSSPAPQPARLVRVLFCEVSGGRARADALARELADLEGARRRARRARGGALATPAPPQPPPPPLAVEAAPFPAPLPLRVAGAVLNALALVSAAALGLDAAAGSAGALRELVRRFAFGALVLAVLGLNSVRALRRTGALEVEFVERAGAAPVLLWSRLGRGARGAEQRGRTPDAEELLEMLPPAPGEGGGGGDAGLGEGGGGREGGREREEELARERGLWQAPPAPAPEAPRRRAAAPVAQPPWSQRRPE
jgi:hypothetical protein